jgi:hypothetical protein
MGKWEDALYEIQMGKWENALHEIQVKCSICCNRSNPELMCDDCYRNIKKWTCKNINELHYEIDTSLYDKHCNNMDND